MAEAASPPSPRSSRAPDLGSITEDKAANPAALERVSFFRLLLETWAQAETRRPQWRLAQHTVTVNRNTGERTAMEALSALVQKRSMSVTSVGAQEQGSGGPRSRARRATVTADPKSLANTFLTHMEIFHKANFVWHPTNYFQSNYQAVLGLFKEVTMIFAREPRCVHVPAPAYVMGDLHGNFQDLCTFGHAFWNQGAAVCPANLVFLGDYVDRRNFSIEVVVYLFAQKLAYPQKVVLLRGNHETRNVNMSFGLLAECQAKFGPNAELVWEELNKAFDHLPLAAVVGESVFCCHGGIPGPECTGEISEINRIPCPLANEDDNILARDLLWSDPAETDGVQDFEPNVDRGVSHKFSSRALEKFLNRNNLDFVIRAHQFKVHLGFQVQKKGRLVTVFSSSGYCGQKNEASCVLVADGKLRMMRLDSIADRMDGPMPVVPGTNFVTQPAAQ